MYELVDEHPIIYESYSSWCFSIYVVFAVRGLSVISYDGHSIKLPLNTPNGSAIRLKPITAAARTATVAANVKNHFFEVIRASSP